MWNLVVNRMGCFEIMSPNGIYCTNAFRPVSVWTRVSYLSLFSLFSSVFLLEILPVHLLIMITEFDKFVVVTIFYLISITQLK